MFEKLTVTRGAAFLAVKSQESSQVSGKMNECWELALSPGASNLRKNLESNSACFAGFPAKHAIECLLSRQDHRTETLMNHRKTLNLNDLARGLQIKEGQPKTNMSNSSTKFQTIDQLIQNRNFESQISIGDQQTELAITRHQFTESKMDFLSDGSGIASCSLIAGISLALLMRRRRCPASTAQDISKKTHSLFSSFRLSMQQIADFLLIRQFFHCHSNPSNGGAVFIKK